MIKSVTLSVFVYKIAHTTRDYKRPLDSEISRVQLAVSTLQLLIVGFKNALSLQVLEATITTSTTLLTVQTTVYLPIRLYNAPALL